MKRIAITGSKGTVASALAKGLDKAKYQLTLLDLPEDDVANIKHLREVLEGHYAVVHCAWKHMNFREDVYEPDDLTMTYNVYQVAAELKIPRVVMASSNHANEHNNRNSDGKLTVLIYHPFQIARMVQLRSLWKH